jgi:peptidoglycan/LPS O-acetylase OafA/YrhL
LIIYGPYEWVDGKAPELRLPVWGIPIHLVISLIFGILLTLFIEDPARKFLKSILAKRKEKNEVQK